MMPPQSNQALAPQPVDPDALGSGGGTMVYTVDLGNGHVMDIEGPKGATPEQLQSVAQQQGGGAAPAQPAAIPPANYATTPNEVQFKDDPKYVASRMSPEDYSTYKQLLQTENASTLRRFLASKGFAGKAGIELDHFVAARDKARKIGAPVSYDPAYELPKPITDETGAVNAGARGVADALTSGTFDEGRAAIDAVNPFSGAHGRENIWNGKSFGDSFNANLDVEHGLVQGDEETHPHMRLAGQLLGGLALPVGLEKAGVTASVESVGLAAGRDALRSGLSMPEARAIAARAMTRRITTEGAIYGGAYGVGSGDTPGDRLFGGVTSAAIGGVGGKLFGAASEKMGARATVAATAPLSEAQQVGAAAERQGIKILPQDVGGPGIGRATQGAAQSPFGTGTVTRAAGQLRASFQDRVGALAGDAPAPVDAGNMVAARAEQAAEQPRLAAERTSGAVEGALGAPVDQTAAGQLVQRGVSRWMDDTQERATALYNQVPIAGDRPAQLGNTRRLLNDLNTEWQSNPQLGALFANGRLSSYLDALTPNVRQTETGLLDASGKAITRDVTEGGNLSWQDLQDFRTRVGDMLNDPRLSEKIAPRQLRALYGSLSSDMEATARDAGPEAMARWRRANNYYDGRMKRINDTFSMVLGDRRDRTPNEAFSGLQSMLRDGSTGNAAAFMRTMRSMPPEDANAVRATIVNGARGGREFDSDAFAKAWGGLSDRGKSALLPQPGMRVMMDDAAGRAAAASQNPFAGMSGEQVFGKLEGMAKSKGDSARFAATMNGLSPDEASAVRSTFIHMGGQPTPGAQNAEGNGFSIARWLTHWNTMTPQAKTVLFGQGEMRAAMNDLATVADRVKGSERLAGHSNTGAVNDFNKTTGGLYGAVAALVTGHPVIAAGLAAPAAYQKLSANILTSPRLLRWLTRVPQQAGVDGQFGYLSKLSTIAAREPAIASQVLGLRDSLRSAISQPPSFAAAAQGAPPRGSLKAQPGSAAN